MPKHHCDPFRRNLTFASEKSDIVRHRILGLSLIPLLLCSHAFPLHAQLGEEGAFPPSTEGVELRPSVLIPMRDGIELSTDLYIPEHPGAERLPVILLRTPYNKKEFRPRSSEAWAFARHGYVFAVQDVRGKFESEGRYRWTTSARTDGYDTVEWLSTRPWSNGRVGTYGCSYRGETQVQLAAAQHPAHAAAIIKAGSATWRGGPAYRNWATNNGGAFELAMIFSWFRENATTVGPQFPEWASSQELAEASAYFDFAPDLAPLDFPSFWFQLPLSSLMDLAGAPPQFPDWSQLLTHGPADSWWGQFDWVNAEDHFSVPVLWVDSWYDYGVSETLALGELFSRNGDTDEARRNQFAVIAPTVHCSYEEADSVTVVGERPVGDARFDYFTLYLDWFDHWLKGEENHVARRAKVEYFLMGQGWRTAPSWPPPDVEFQDFFLHSGGAANSRFGDGVLSHSRPEAEPADSFTYDPRTPVPTVGGQACCTGDEAVEGGADQSTVEIRNDILVYTTEVLREGIEVTGPLEAVLYVSSSAPDTDFTVKLVDVYPDGRAFNVQEGIRRARYREGFGHETFMEEDQVYEVAVDMHATANYFPAGHRIRIEVSSSNFPRFDRNLNTGGSNRTDTVWAVARNVVYHSADYPSRLVLPVAR